MFVHTSVLFLANIFDYLQIKKTFEHGWRTYTHRSSNQSTVCTRYNVLACCFATRK